MSVIRAAGAALFAVTTILAPTFAQTTTAGWRSADSGATDRSSAGVIDTPADGATVAASGPITVSGWYVDTSAQGWSGATDLKLFVGTMDSGTLLARGQVGLDRPDVAAALGNAYWASAGWSATFDGSQLPSGQTVLSAYIGTPARGWLFQQVAVTNAGGSAEILAPAPAAQGPPPRVTILTPQPGESVSTSNRRYTISGTASDATTGGRGIDWVELWLNGEANTDGAIRIGDADLANDGTWSFVVDVDRYLAINSNLYAYAHSAVNGKRSLAVVHFYITDRH